MSAMIRLIKPENNDSEVLNKERELWSCFRSFHSDKPTSNIVNKNNVLPSDQTWKGKN